MWYYMKMKTNMPYSDLVDVKNKGIPIYIWGAGEIGRLTHRKLDEIGVPIKDHVVDVPLLGGGIDRLELLGRNEQFVIVRGFLSAFCMSDKEIMNRFPGCINVYSVTDIYEPEIVEPIDKQYYLDNISLFRQVRDSLADELSKETFDAFIEAKTQKNIEKLSSLMIPNQYFFEDCPWKYSSEETYVDCGAYDGDSIRDFIKIIGENYKEIIAFEPDEKNYCRLKEWIDKTGICNIDAIKAGVHSEEGALHFCSSGDMESFANELGEQIIKVNSIDNVCEGKRVTIIKMDVEGSELDALKGARSTIIDNKPILMISAYHKRNDLFILQNFINSLCQDYSYFIRAHKPLSVDMVLYAIPEDRIKL